LLKGELVEVLSDWAISAGAFLYHFSRRHFSAALRVISCMLDKDVPGNGDT
jgi:hypothetical protein